MITNYELIIMDEKIFLRIKKAQKIIKASIQNVDKRLQIKLDQSNTDGNKNQS